MTYEDGHHLNYGIKTIRLNTIKKLTRGTLGLALPPFLVADRVHGSIAGAGGW